MDWRDAAKNAVAHVQGDWINPWRSQRGGFVTHIWNDAEKVADVEGAGLLRNIGAGEMMVQKGVQVVAPGFRQHGARAVLQKAVHHHPVVSGQLAKLHGGDVAQVL
jgi:hypothetical protein